MADDRAENSRAIGHPETLVRVTGLGEHTDLQAGLDAFLADHPDPTKTVFIMMPFGASPHMADIVDAIRQTLKRRGFDPVRADERHYADHLWDNLLIYMTGSLLGIAVFEKIDHDDFNPNVALELGHMLATQRRCLLLKDRQLRQLPTDVLSRIYRQFDSYDIKGTIPPQLERWIDDDLRVHPARLWPRVSETIEAVDSTPGTARAGGTPAAVIGEPTDDQRMQAIVTKNNIKRDVESILTGFPTDEYPNVSTTLEQLKGLSTELEEALRLYPNLPASRGFFGLSVAELVRMWVKRAALGGYYWLDSVPVVGLAEVAASWLDAAIRHGEDQDGSMALVLVRMLAVTRQTNVMFDAIEGLVVPRPGLSVKLSDPESLLLLAFGIDRLWERSDEDVRRLCEDLGLMLPAPLDEFVASIQDVETGHQGLHWIAVARQSYWNAQTTSPRSPLLLLVWVKPDSGNRLTKFGYFLSAPVATRVDIPPAQDYTSPEELYETISQQFVLIAPYGRISPVL